MTGQAPLPFDDDTIIDPEGWTRTRATAWDVLRAAEVWHYRAICVENVPEFVTDWSLFEVWLLGLRKLGYRTQILSLNSAHASGPGNPAAPQWRDRVYIVATQRHMTAPDLRPRPEGWCRECDRQVRTVQRWLCPSRVGKYGPRGQYVYACPRCRTTVEPAVRPVRDVLDLADTGQRIGDRRVTVDKPDGMAPATITRVNSGLARFAPEPFTVIMRRNATALPLDGPVAAVTAGGRHHALATPDGGSVRACRFRMFTPVELAALQRFPRDYVFCGTAEEQYMQIGNAVSVNVAHWIGARLSAVL